METRSDASGSAGRKQYSPAPNDGNEQNEAKVWGVDQVWPPSSKTMTPSEFLDHGGWEIPGG